MLILLKMFLFPLLHLDLLLDDIFLFYCLLFKSISQLCLHSITLIPNRHTAFTITKLFCSNGQTLYNSQTNISFKVSHIKMTNLDFFVAFFSFFLCFF